MAATPALSAPSVGAPFEHTAIERRALGEHDVQIDVKYCGICHSDIHQVKDEWGGSIYPMVPGHEIAGVVAAVGSAVEKLSVGDRVGVGCLVDSCEECEYCLSGEEQFCTKGARVELRHDPEHGLGEPRRRRLSAPAARGRNPRERGRALGAGQVPRVLTDRRQAKPHGSSIGGLSDTQEMLDFCPEHGVKPAIELIDADAAGDAYEPVERSDVRYRFVIDAATIG